MMRRESRAPSQRQLRVGEQVRHALAAILERGEVRDPGLATVSVTVTEVRMTPDLRRAMAFVVPLGGGDVEEVVAALTRARPFLRHRVADIVRLRFAPELSFHGDTVFDRVESLERLFRDPAVARDLEHDRDATGGADGT